MSKTLDPRAKAIAAQLKAEISRSEHGNAADFNRALVGAGNASDYTTLTQRVNGSVAIPMESLFMYLDVLGIEVEAFFEDAFRYYRRDVA